MGVAKNPQKVDLENETKEVENGAEFQYYKWREQFLKQGAKIFELGTNDKVLDRAKAENRKLKAIIGDLTVELKKTEDELAWLES